MEKLRIRLGWIARIGLVVGGLHLLGCGFGVPLLDILGPFATVAYLFIGLCALYLVADRDTYLPFLGPAHIPCGALEPRVPVGANRELVIRTAPNKKVLYWAAEPAMEGLKNIPSWKGAYLGYENTGVAVSDAEGRAVLQVRNPQPYHVPIKGLLDPHVHYRVCEDSGWLGRVMTIPVDGTPDVEGYTGPESEYAAGWV